MPRRSPSFLEKSRKTFLQIFDLYAKKTSSKHIKNLSEKFINYRYRFKNLRFINCRYRPGLFEIIDYCYCFSSERFIVLFTACERLQNCFIPDLEGIGHIPKSAATNL